ncbi:unnamed protein product [Ophioblennius macclurei]
MDRGQQNPYGMARQPYPSPDFGMDKDEDPPYGMARRPYPSPDFGMDKDQHPPYGMATPPYSSPNFGMDKDQHPPYGMATPPYSSPNFGTAPNTYPMQPPGYDYNPNNPPNAVMQQPMANMVMVSEQSFGELPVLTTCPHCHTSVSTSTKYVTGGLTWLLCIVFGCILCCLFFWIPFVVNSAKDVEHYCPNCSNIIYRYKRL